KNRTFSLLATFTQTPIDQRLIQSLHASAKSSTSVPACLVSLQRVVTAYALCFQQARRLAPEKHANVRQESARGQAQSKTFGRSRRGRGGDQSPMNRLVTSLATVQGNSD